MTSNRNETNCLPLVCPGFKTGCLRNPLVSKWNFALTNRLSNQEYKANTWTRKSLSMRSDNLTHLTPLWHWQRELILNRNETRCRPLLCSIFKSKHRRLKNPLSSKLHIRSAHKLSYWGPTKKITARNPILMMSDHSFHLWVLSESTLALANIY